MSGRPEPLGFTADVGAPVGELSRKRAGVQ
jgi:hypothetical protein